MPACNGEGVTLRKRRRLPIDAVRRPTHTAARNQGPHVIRHIVFFSAAEKGSIDVIRQGLSRLADIGEAQHFEVLPNLKVDPFNRDVDLVVYAEFADEAALSRYKAHPIYSEVTRMVKPMRDLRISADVATQV